MIAFALANQNLPFAVALVLMLLIAILEGVTTILGMGLSGFLDSLMPEMDVDIDLDMDVDMDVDMDADIDGPDFHTGTPLTKMLSWLRIGQVPVLVLLVIFLTAFGLFGLGTQSVALRLTGRLMPSIAAAGIALLLALPMVRMFGGILARVMPKDETEAVSEKSFIGLVAVITTGTARHGGAAQGKLQDRHGQTHYIMIEPDDAQEIFVQGTEVILVRQQGAIFKAIKNTSPLLGNKDRSE